MKKIGYYSLKNIERNLGSIILFIGQLTIFIFFAFLCLTQLMTVQQYGVQIKTLREFNPVYFNTYYGPEGMKYTSGMLDLLSEVFNEKKGFSSVDNIRISDYPDMKVIVGVGAFGEVFGLTGNSDPTVFIGSKVTELQAGDRFTFGSDKIEEFRIDQKLSHSASYLSKQTSVNLDHSMIILISFDQLNSYYKDIYLEPLIGNTALINPRDEEVDQFVTTMSQSQSLNFSPVKFNTIAHDFYQENLLSSLFFLLFFLTTIMFTCIGIVSSILRMISRNLQEYSIHRLYGATLVDLYAQIVMYIVFILVFPLILTALLIRFAAPQQIPTLMIIGLGLIAAASLSYIPLHRLRKYDMTFFLRRDS